MDAAKETVNNVISAASNMIYGDSSQSNAAGTEQKHDSLLGDEGQSANNPDSTTTDTSTSDSTAPKSSATATSAQDVGSAPPESGAAPVANQQGADKPGDTPDAGESQAISDKKDAAESAMDGDGSSAPGGGSSGPSDDAGPKPLGSTTGKSDDNQDDELGSKSQEHGTGEKWIKSTGMAADGGDFDAANAGAGREADRLLEEKGITREEGNTGPPQEIPGNKRSSSSSGSDKPSLKDKLKDKLHIGSKDKA